MRWVALGMVVAFSAGCSDKSYSDDLLHASSEKRVAAAAFLGAQRDQNAVGALIAVLGDSMGGAVAIMAAATRRAIIIAATVILTGAIITAIIIRAPAIMSMITPIAAIDGTSASANIG